MPIDYPAGTMPNPNATGAERFRITVDGKRHYVDTLPADNTYDEDATQYPSVTSIKPEQSWSNATYKRLAEAYLEHPARWVGSDRKTISRDMREVDGAGLDAASERGTGVHAIAEELLTGQAVMFAPDSAESYRASVEAWFAEHKPQCVAAEFVVFSRSYGYAGTADAIVIIDGLTYLIDFKSRAESHAAYPYDGAQLGGYSMADYMIVGDERRRLPKIDGLLVVSITPSGARTYPVDLDKAQQLWKGMLRWYQHRQTERDVLLDAWPTVKAPEPVEPFDRAAYLAADDAGHHGYVKASNLAHLVARIASSPNKALVNDWIREAETAGRPFNPRTTSTPRRFDITAAAHHLSFIPSDDVFDLIEAVAPDVTGHAVGVRLGQLTSGEATRLAVMATEYLTDPAAPAA